MSKSVANYYQLSPLERPAASTLMQMHNSLLMAIQSPRHKTTPQERRALANIALETSIAPELSHVKRRRWQAETARNFEHTRRDNKAGLQAIYATFLQLRASPESSRQTALGVRSYIQNLQSEYARYKGPGVNRDPLHSLARKAVVLALVGHTGLEGVVAYPSLERQSESTQQLDDKRLTWDITVESDGTSLPTGTYHTRVVKAFNTHSGIASQYHRSISVIDAEKQLYLDHNNPQSLYGLGNMVTELATTGNAELAGGLCIVRDGLVKRLEATGPATEELHILAQ